MDAWVDRELGDGSFPDRRLRTRLGKILGDLGRRIGGTLPAACQDWAATKAAYRFFSNLRVDEGVTLVDPEVAEEAVGGLGGGPVLARGRQRPADPSAQVAEDLAEARPQPA